MSASSQLVQHWPWPCLQRGFPDFTRRRVKTLLLTLRQSCCLGASGETFIKIAIPVFACIDVGAERTEERALSTVMCRRTGQPRGRSQTPGDRAMTRHHDAGYRDRALIFLLASSEMDMGDRAAA
jgi:hypothetical protein